MSDNGRDNDALALAQAVQNGDWPRALRAVQAMEKRVPGDSRILYNKALVFREMGNQAARQESLLQAIAADPLHAHARFELGAVLLDEGRIAEAATHFTHYVELAPKDWEGLVNLGNCLLLLGRPADALPYLKDAHEHTANVDTVTALARCWRDLGQFEACEDVLGELGASAQMSALKLKIRTQGSKGRFSLFTDQEAER